MKTRDPAKIMMTYERLKPKKEKTTMTIFHLDFNHVSMRYDVIHDLLPQIAAMGYNAILWELEAQVAWETCPECATPETWSKDQFRQLLAFSRELGLEPIPLFQTIGHAEYVMSHAKYHAFREDPNFCDCYCVSNPEVRPFLKRWIAEYRDLFGELQHFHLGGDEAYRFGSCATCSARNRLELYGEHINELAEALLADGVRPGVWGDPKIWGDVILAAQSGLDSISRDFLIWDWNYGDGVEPPPTVRISGLGQITQQKVTPELSQRFPELLDDTGSLNTFYSTRVLKKRGYDIVLCSAARSGCDGPLSPETSIHAANIVGAEQLSRQKGLIGHCVTSWAFRLNLIRTGFPLMALPETVAASPAAGIDAWRKEVSRKYFGFEDGLTAADLISRCDIQLRSYSALQWNGLKDGTPTPKDHLAQRIKLWTTEENSWWQNRAEMLADMRQSTTEGMQMLEPYAPDRPIASLWIEAAKMQLDYLDLLQAIFVYNANLTSMTKPLQHFRANLEAFFGYEQAPLSARANTTLIVNPLLDYLEWRA